MAYSYGRQFRRIAAQALTADREEMDALIARILPPRDDGARELQVKSKDDCKRAPAAIVAAFFADAITGDEAADLLRQTEDPAFRKQAREDEVTDFYALYGPACLVPGWRSPDGRPYVDVPSKIEYAPWPVSEAPRRSATTEAAALVNNNENTSAAGRDAAAKPEEAFVWRSVDPDRPRRNVWDAPPQIKVRIDTGTAAGRDAAKPPP
jgi:hypothetical protein